MSKEKKTVELKDEELEKVSGGNSKTTGNCGVTTMLRGCAQYNSAQDQCNSCLGKPLTLADPSSERSFKTS